VTYNMFKGIPSSPGIAIGKAFLYRTAKIEVVLDTIGDNEIDDEIVRFENAKLKTKQQIERIYTRAVKTMGQDKAEIFKAHIAILEDPMLTEKVVNYIREEKLNAIASLDRTIKEFCSVFDGLDDEYMRERAVDIKDVGKRLLGNLAGIDTQSLRELPGKAIIIAEDLTPSDTAELNADKVMGFATDIGGKTSHTAIIARTLEIPAVLGLKDISKKVKQGDTVIVDGYRGKVFVNPTKEQVEEYIKLKRDLKQEERLLQRLRGLPAVTKDNRRVEISANIGVPDDVKTALKYGAEGVGLFRTEFLYMNRDMLPTEDEQYEEYKRVALDMGGRPVIIRTLDIGGDKDLPYFGFPKELNPFLGWRAIRMCLDRTDIFETQLRALLRASIHGNLKIMYPMISGIAEIRSANKILNEVKKDLDIKGIPYKKDLEVGIMVEIPSAAIMADALIKEVDFFSIGTNDLTQYTLAVDRTNEKISDLYDPLHPSVLRLVRNVIEESHKAGKWTGMCGELAGDPMAAVVLLGLGLDEFSMSASSIPKIKQIIRNTTYEEAKRIADHVINMSTGQEVRDYIRACEFRLT
jgi:phosphotransferase system enzyme I (PtsI)